MRAVLHACPPVMLRSFCFGPHAVSVVFPAAMSVSAPVLPQLSSPVELLGNNELEVCFWDETHVYKVEDLAKVRRAHVRECNVEYPDARDMTPLLKPLA